MKFGQLIECNLRNIFLQKPYTICGGETSPRPFSEKLKLSLSLDQQSKVLYSLFLLCWGLSKYIETKLPISCFDLILSFVKKSERGLKPVSMPHFLHNFWRKIFLLLYSINWPNLIVWLPLLCEILGNMCTAIVCKPGCDVWTLKLTLSF